MSETSPSTPHAMSPDVGEPAFRTRFRLILRSVLYCSLLVALGIVGYTIVRAAQDQAALKVTSDRLVAGCGLIQPSRKHLAREYKDQHGRLMADPPSNPKLLLDPDTLVMAYFKDADADTQLVDWNSLRDKLAAATGKTVVGQEYRNNADDVAAVKTGTIQIVALHAADAPYVVNNAGFIPIAVLGTESGAHGNRLDIAVGAKSDIQSIANIRGHMLTCTAPDSMTGYRAAIVMLSQEGGLRPDADYSINFSLGQKRSILGLVSGEYEVAALSDDKVQSMLKDGSIKESDYRVIFQSEVLPRLTVGYVYNLKPELAAQVRSAVLDFDNQAGASAESSGKPMRFFAIDYAKDFDFVRKIDNSFDPRFRKTSNSDAMALPAGNPTQD